MTETYDLAIIGGGINGAGIARDAAGRGLKVLLCERDDIGGATSSSSTKLIHGGLRYLEHGEFRLVRHALAERERIWSIAPHIVWPLRFVLPHRTGLRPAWLLRLGLFLYDHLGGREQLPGTKTLRLATDGAGLPLREVSSVGFEYSDCWVQDNRLVVLNARDARARGATILPRTTCVAARRRGRLWEVEMRGQDATNTDKICARALVNSTGPWVNEVIAAVTHTKTTAEIRLVQGSHVVVPRLYDHDRCYIFQNPDGRIFFAIPYEEDFTLIGTTDRDYLGDPAHVAPTTEEIEYLCHAASSYFRQQVIPDDVVWSYSGVRPLYQDNARAAQAATRDYVLKTDRPGPDDAPLLSVFGGKITTYRVLAEDALRKLARFDPSWATREGWTAKVHLPGGDFPVGGAEDLANALRDTHPFLTGRQAMRLVRHYGTDAFSILSDARRPEDLGCRFGSDLTEAEVNHLITEEFAVTATDIIWRRTKAGLRMSTQEVETLENWLARHVRAPAATL